MIEINLLPDEMRHKNRGLGIPKAAQAGIAGMVIAVALMASVTYYQKAQLAYVNNDVTRVEAKVQQMKSDIELVDRLVDVKTRIMRRLGAIETLDRNRTAWVENMQDLAEEIRRRRIGKELWRILMLAGLGVLLLEALLAYVFAKRIRVDERLARTDTREALLADRGAA